MQRLLLQSLRAVAQLHSRSISISVAALKNHYEALELGTRCTQNEIKSAYYRLSKLYHPDKNKGSELAAEKFREVTAAYEVLGNYRLRKLYDKGILHTAGAEFADTVQHEVVVEDDPQTKFYKQRMKRTEAPTASGAAPIYDFDEWSREHYAQSFKRKQQAQQRYERQVAKDADATNSLKLDRIIYVVLIMIAYFAAKTMIIHEDLDKPKTPPKT